MSNNSSKILLDKSPKDINTTTEEIIDILFEVNEVVRELNSIDFCNPLGYIMTKAIPADGIISSKLTGYGNIIKKKINFIENKINVLNTDELINNIEEIRLSLEEIIPDQELQGIIPGGDGIVNFIQNLNDSLVITNTFLSPFSKKQLLESLVNRLLPLSNPFDLAQMLLDKQIQELNSKLTNIIKPERFREGLKNIIKLIIRIDKGIEKIQKIVILINKIIKSLNVLIKITKLIINLLKKIPTPAKYVTVGATVTSSTKASKLEIDLDNMSKILSITSKFLSVVVVKQIKRIRNEIFILLIGLNQLYENLNSCRFFENDSILIDIQNSINNLNNNIFLLEELFPSIKENENNTIYKGYNINIIVEETTDNRIDLVRRRVIVTNQQNIIEYESTSTYSNDDQILIKEAQYFIESKLNTQSSNKGKDNISDEETEILLKQMGYSSSNLTDAIKKEKEINSLLLNQIKSNPEDKKIYEQLNPQDNPNPTKVEQVKKISEVVSKNLSNPILIQIRLKRLSNSLLSKGYTQEEIVNGFNKNYSQQYNIIINNNNISINLK